MDVYSLPQRIAQRLTVRSGTHCFWNLSFCRLEVAPWFTTGRVCAAGRICSMCSEWPVGDFYVKARFFGESGTVSPSRRQLQTIVKIKLKSSQRFFLGGTDGTVGRTPPC